MSKQIMIVDDDVDNLELMQLMLECAGYDAREICKHLKTNELTKAVPIIMLSAYVPIRQLRESYPADDFLAKPFELDTLLDKVEKLLS